MCRMRLLSWNVHGLGKEEKRRMVRSMISSQNIDMILIQESKWQHTQERMVRQLWYSDDFGWEAMDSERSSGGLLCI